MIGSSVKIFLLPVWVTIEISFSSIPDEKALAVDSMTLPNLEGNARLHGCSFSSFARNRAQNSVQFIPLLILEHSFDVRQFEIKGQYA